MANGTNNSGQTGIYEEKDIFVRDSMILELYKREPERAIFIAKQLNSPLATKLKGTEITQIDAVTENIIKTMFRIEAKAASTATETSDAITSNIDKLGNSITSGIRQAKMNLNEALKPVSRATGEVLAGATKIIENPLGAPFVIGNSIGHLMDKISPGFTNRLDAAYKKLGLENMSHFPAQVVGSLKQLMSAAASVACLPLSLIGELNQVLINISNAINKLIDKVSAAVYDFFFGPNGVLDSVLPLDLINDFLSAVQELSSVLGAIGILSGGSASFLSTLGQVNSFIGSASLAFSNPAALAASYLNNNQGFNQVAGVLRNPQGALQKLIPPKVSEKLMQLSTFCSIAQTGDLGFAFSAFLGGPKGRALQFLLTKFANKSNSVKPLLNVKTVPEIPEESLPQEVPAAVGTQQEDKVTGVKTVETQQATRPQPPLEEQTSDEEKVTYDQLKAKQEFPDLLTPPYLG
jgi:hypothetical protein